MDIADPLTRPWEAGVRDHRDERDERPGSRDIEPIDAVLALFVCSAAVLVVTAVLHIALILRLAQMDPAVNTAVIGYGALVMGAALVALPAGLLALRWSRSAQRDAAGDARWGVRARASDSVEDGLVVAPTVTPAAVVPAPASATPSIRPPRMPQRDDAQAPRTSDTALGSRSGPRPRSHASTVASSPASRPVSPPARTAPQRPAARAARPQAASAPSAAATSDHRWAPAPRTSLQPAPVAWAAMHPAAPWLVPQHQ